MSGITTFSNPDLLVVDGNKPHWNTADHRRHGFHNLHRIARYGISLRAASTMVLEKRMDLRIAAMDKVRYFTSLPWFSAMIIIRDGHILFERYAPDFGPDRPHSMQSITKTLMNLIVGKLVDLGVLDLSKRIEHYIPAIGSGYADCSLHQVLNMDLMNEYSEDFTDPHATYYRHEEAMGWRLPIDAEHEETQRRFIAKIESRDTTNRTGYIQYKDANTDVLGWVVESASGILLRSFLVDIIDAAGIEGTFHITTDREGVPSLDGGGCLSARDLARYFSIFVRRGRGIGGEVVGSAAFIEQTLMSGIPMQPYAGIRYSNHTMVSNCSLGHGGWGGQYALANLETGKVAVFFSVIENEHAANNDYLPEVIQMLESVTARSS